MTCVLQTKTWCGKVRLEEEVDVREVGVGQQGLQPEKDSSILGSKIFLAPLKNKCERVSIAPLA